MRTACEKGFNVVTVTDCCAATSKEGHDAAAAGTFGMFGLNAATSAELPRPTENYVGVLLACIALALYLFIKVGIQSR